MAFFSHYKRFLGHDRILHLCAMHFLKWETAVFIHCNVTCGFAGKTVQLPWSVNSISAEVIWRWLSFTLSPDK